MVRSGCALLFLAAALPGAAPLDSARGRQEDVAKATLRKFSARFREMKSLSAAFTQNRRTVLLDEPIKSSGKLHYRREPARLVFDVEKPRKAAIHFDGKTYQVYRPEEKQLEQFELEDSEMARWLFMAFHPKVEEIEKSFRISAGSSKDGALEVILEPTEPKLLKVIERLTLVLAQTEDAGDAMLRRITYVDSEKEEVSFDLAGARLNPELPAETFELKVPEGVRVLKHGKKNGK